MTDDQPGDQRVTWEIVASHLRKQNFAVLSTVGAAGSPHSAGVNYGVSGSDNDITIFVMTRRHLRKARNIAQNSEISLVVPLTRRLLWFLPPPTIQLHGHAEIVDWQDDAGTKAFRRLWIGRRILKAYEQSHRRGETRICFLRIKPDPVINVREYIEAARSAQSAEPVRADRAGRSASEASLRTDTELAKQDNRRLRAEVDRLRKALQERLGAELETSSTESLKQRVDELLIANDRYRKENSRLVEELDNSRSQLRTAEEDLAASRTSLRRMIRESSSTPL